MRCWFHFLRLAFVALLTPTIVHAQDIAFSNFNAHGAPQTIKVGTEITVTVQYTLRGRISSVSDGQKTATVSRTPVGRPSSVQISNWLTVIYEYGPDSTAKRLYDNFGNQLSFILRPYGVREDVYVHASAAKESADYLKALDPAVLDGLPAEPAAAALALLGILQLEPSDVVAALGRGVIRLAQSSSPNPATTSLSLRGLLEAFIPSAQAASIPLCAPATYLALTAWVAYACKSGQTSRCLPSDSCEQNGTKITRRSNCIAARKTINKKCFAGGDAGHRQQVQQEIDGIIEPASINLNQAA
jgi:hypothetical protein